MSDDMITVLAKQSDELTKQDATITALTAEVEEQRKRRRVWQQRVLKVRHVLAGTDWAALPSDYPVEQMAQDRMNDITRLTSRVKELEGALKWYADPERYSPHPHGPAFDRRDIGYVARAVLSASQPAPQKEGE